MNMLAFVAEPPRLMRSPFPSTMSESPLRTFVYIAFEAPLTRTASAIKTAFSKNGIASDDRNSSLQIRDKYLQNRYRNYDASIRELCELRNGNTSKKLNRSNTDDVGDKKDQEAGEPPDLFDIVLLNYGVTVGQFGVAVPLLSVQTIRPWMTGLSGVLATI